MKEDWRNQFKNWMWMDKLEEVNSAEHYKIKAMSKVSKTSEQVIWS